MNFIVNDDGTVTLSKEVRSFLNTLISDVAYIREAYTSILKKDTIKRVDLNYLLDQLFRLYLNNYGSEKVYNEKMSHSLRDKLFSKLIETYSFYTVRLNMKGYELLEDGYNGKTFDYFEKKGDFKKLSDMLEIFTYIQSITNQIAKAMDLYLAEVDYQKNMKYCMTSEEADDFHNRFLAAVSKSDVNSQYALLNGLNKRIKDDWISLTNNPSRDSSKFTFLGHSVKSNKIDFDKFWSRYISCSLFTEKLHSTFNEEYGFIMDPHEIVAAASDDMYAYNFAKNEEELLAFSVIPRISHPGRVIDECEQRLIDHEEFAGDLAFLDYEGRVYSEIVVDGFHPIGIFCFTNGSLSFDENYLNAKKLSALYPKLPFYAYDTLKFKKGRELTIDKYHLLLKLSYKASSKLFVPCDDIERYDIFFKMFDKLKENVTYNEEQIIKIFKYATDLVIYSNDINEDISRGKLDPDTVKYILGHSLKYSVDFILNGKAHPKYLESLISNLSDNYDGLDEFYEGIEEFIHYASKNKVRHHINEELVKKINGLGNTSFKEITELIINEFNLKRDYEKGKNY